MSKKSLQPEDFAWVPVGYGIVVIVMGVGILVSMFEEPGQAHVSKTIMGVALAMGLVGFAVFLIQIATGAKDDSPQ